MKKLYSASILVLAFFATIQSINAQSNVLVNNNAGATATGYFTQSTTSLLAFGNNVVVGFNDAGSHQANANKYTGFAYSTDGGASFTDGGTLPTSSGGDIGDPVLARNNTTGRIYLSTLSFTGTSVFRSDDNGQTWMPPVAGTPGGGSSESRPWITVDNFSGSGNGNVYMVSRRFSGFQGLYLFRSVDNGTTFGPPGGTILVAGTAINGGFVAVGPDHSVFVFWFEAGAGNSIKMRRSTDQGITFGPTVTVVTGLIGGSNGDLGLTGVREGTTVAASFRSNEFPQAAINPVSGHIYLTYNNRGASPDKADIFFVMSTNGGATWSAPTKVNDDATTTDQWLPAIAVTPDGLNLGIFYYSRQIDPASNNLFKYYSRIATISGTTINFGQSAAVSDVVSLPEFGRDAVFSPTYMADYNQAVATAAGFFVTWSDNRSDFTLGSPRKDPNVYFSSLPVTGIVLPVKLKSFTAVRVNENKDVQLNWVTASEQNNDGFWMQRKTDAGWIDIGSKIESKAGISGTTIEPQSYSSLDVNNLFSGLSQYRLKQMDIDGKVTLSDIRAVKGAKQGKKMMVYPNPSNTGTITIVHDNTGQSDIIVRDMGGRTIREIRGSSSNTIVIENLRSGVFNIQVRDRTTSESQFQKVIVKRK